MLDVYGSKHSLLPRIWQAWTRWARIGAMKGLDRGLHVAKEGARTCAVDAVGMGATSSELYKPWRAMRARSAGQSHLADGVTPHRSGCSTPRLAGDPG